MKMEIGPPPLDIYLPPFPREITGFLEFGSFLFLQGSSRGRLPAPSRLNISLALKMTIPGALSLWYEANISISAVIHSLQIDSFQEAFFSVLLQFFSLVLFRQWYEVPLSGEELSNTVWKCIKFSACFGLFFFFPSAVNLALVYFVLF